MSVLLSFRSAKDGAYFLETGTGVTEIYCHMSELPSCGKGYTMIMKINGHKVTHSFLYTIFLAHTILDLTTSSEMPNCAAIFYKLQL